MRSVTFICWVLAGATLCWPVCAGTIVAVGGPVFGGQPLSGSGTHVAVAWSSSVPFSDVQISALLGSFVASAGRGNVYTGTAYLTNQLGPGTTAANEIASSDFAFPPDPPFPGTLVPLFSGLSLGPGTFYFVISGHDTFPCESSVGCGLWHTTENPPTINLAPGVASIRQFVSTGPGYAPALGWIDGTSGPYRVIFDVSSVPEPVSLLSFLTGLLALGTVRIRRSYRPRQSDTATYPCTTATQKSALL